MHALVQSHCTRHTLHNTPIYIQGEREIEREKLTQLGDLRRTDGGSDGGAEVAEDVDG